MDSAMVPVVMQVVGCCLLAWSLREFWRSTRKPPEPSVPIREEVPSEWYVQSMAELDAERQETDEEMRRTEEEREMLRETEQRKTAELRGLAQERLAVEEHAVQSAASLLSERLFVEKPCPRKKS
jgi:hypothetical protein